MDICVTTGLTYPRISSFSRVRRTSTLTLTCVTSRAPPTNLQWTRNGITLDIDDTTHRVTQTVTNRHLVYYNNKLEIFDHIDNVTGLYTCTVKNRYYSPQNRSLTISGLLTITIQY